MTEEAVDRLVASWLASDGPERVPAGLSEAAFATARGLAQRRGLRAIATGPGAWPGRRGLLGRRRVSLALRAALVGLVVLSIIGASLFVASRLTKPAPPRLLGVVEPTGSMGQPRFQPQVTLLLDGMVLVTGGAGDGEVVTAELYDPHNGSFAPVGPMGTGNARGRVSAQVRLADGRVFVAGSTGGDVAGVWPFTPFALIYDHATRAFTPAIQTPDATPNLTGRTATLSPDGRVRLDGGPGVTTAVWFDPTSGSFTQTNTDDVGYPDSDLGPVVVVLRDGRRLLIGTRPDLHQFTDLYDPRNGSLTDLGQPPLIAGLLPEATVLPDGRVLLLGGGSAMLDPATGRFTTIDSEADHLAGFAADGLAVLTNQNGSDGSRGHIWTFDPATDTVTALDAMIPDGCCAAWTSLSDGRLLGVGGLVGEHPSATALIVR